MKRTAKAMALFSAILILFVTAAGSAEKVYAMDSAFSFGDMGVLDEGKQYAVSWSVSATDPMTASLTFAVSGASMNGLSASVGSVNGATLVLAGVDGIRNISGTMTITVSSSSQVTLSVSGNVSSLISFTKNGIAGSKSYSVRSAAQQQEDAAAASRRAAEESSRAAAEAAQREAEQRRQESIAAASRAERERIDASIRAEQSKKAASEAEEASRVHASIAESLSVEESSRFESLSVEESVSESESRIRRESEEESKAAEESIRNSEEEDDRTRAVEVDGSYYVPYRVKRKAFTFLFASEDTEGPEVPGGFTRTELTVNRQKVLAASAPGFGTGVYLVFGRTEEEEEPGWFLFDSGNDSFFSYEGIGVFKEESPETTGTSETELPSYGGDETEIFDVTETLPLTVCAFLLGVVATLLIMIPVLVIKRKKADRKGKGTASGEIPETTEDVRPSESEEDTEEGITEETGSPFEKEQEADGYEELNEALRDLQNVVLIPPAADDTAERFSGFDLSEEDLIEEERPVPEKNGDMAEEQEILQDLTGK